MASVRWDTRGVRREKLARKQVGRKNDLSPIIHFHSLPSSTDLSVIRIEIVFTKMIVQQPVFLYIFVPKFEPPDSCP